QIGGIAMRSEVWRTGAHLGRLPSLDYHAELLHSSVHGLDLFHQPPEALGERRVDVHGPLEERVGRARAHDELENLHQLAPSLDRIAAPRIRSVSASTTSFISPAGSARSTARCTQAIGILPILSRRPVARASFSVRPTRPSCGSVKTAYG